MAELEQMFTVADVANMTSMSDRTIRNYLRNGLLTGRKVGGQWRFTWQDIMNFLGQGEVKSAVAEQQKGEIMDFVDGVNTGVSGERQACLIVDLYVSKEDADNYNERLCELFAPGLPEDVRFYYDYSDREKRARFTLFTSPAVAGQALDILK